MKTVLVVGLLGLAVAASAQDSAKSLFVDPTSGVSVQSSNRPQPGYTAPASDMHPGGAPQTVAVNPVTGLMYWIELRTDKGQLLRVNATRQFKAGERIRLHVTSNVDGVLNIMQSQNDEPFSMLFPTQSGGDNRVQRFQEKVFPSPNAFFRFDSRPGNIRLLLMVQATAGSDAPLSPAAQVAASRQARPVDPPATTAVPKPAAAPPSRPVTTASAAPAPATTEAEMLAEIEKVRGSKALMVENDDSTTEAATYTVVDARKSSDVKPGVLAVEVKLAQTMN
jgi:hypothetical protein